MKKLTQLYWVFLFLGCLLFGSCEENEDPFTGGDNYITSFTLYNGDIHAKAMIEDGKITVTAPLGFLLDGAVAKVQLSENSKIVPDPSTITDWGSEYVFKVTSQNGTTRNYRYSALNDGSSAGSVILATQADVDRFGRSGIESVAGNLIIGMTAGRDSITSLAPLDKLREIGYNLVIKSTYANHTLDGFSKLETIGRSLRIENSQLTDARFPALRMTMNVDVVSSRLISLACPKLSGVTGSMNFTIIKLKTISMPELENVNGSLNFGVPKQNDLSDLEHISFPKLKRIDNRFTFGDLSSLKTISLPELTTCREIYFGINSVCRNVTSITMPKLEECRDELNLHQLPALTKVSFPSLKHAGSLIIYGCNAETFELSKLIKVDKNLELTGLGNLSAEGFSCLESLTDVGGEFHIGYGMTTSVSSLNMPPRLKNCKSLEFFDCATLRSVDLRGINIGELRLERASLVDMTIKADNVFKGRVVIKGESSSNLKGDYEYTFPKFEGVSEIGTLHMESSMYMKKLIMKGIRKINGDFTLNYNELQAYELNELTEVTGNFYTGNGSYMSMLEFPAIKKIGGYIKVSTYSNDYALSAQRLSFPDLESAGGISLPVASHVAEISMPKLTTIADSLIIICPQSHQENTVMTNLNGFNALKTVRVVQIESMQALISYEGLKSCLTSLVSDNQWKLIYNRYEPSLSDMKAGNWNAPNN